MALGWAGCGSSEGTVSIPSYNPGSSSSQAVSLFDENKNGTIEGAELIKCPGLQTALPRIDQDGDGKLTAGEISTRIAFYKSKAVGLTSVHCVVTKNGVPLQNAKVTFQPEEFMKSTLRAASGTTDNTGRAGLKREDLEFPGMQIGLYRVLVSLPNEMGAESIPPEFNEKTTLGAEIAPDVPGLERGLVFDLKFP